MSIYDSMKQQATRLESGLLAYCIDMPQKQRVHLMLWQPRAIKPYFNYLVKPDELQKHIDDHNSRLLKHKEIIAERKEKNKLTPDKLEKVSIGSIFYCSWGYDQTNIDFYQVVSIKGLMLEIRPIGSEMMEQTSWASGVVTAIKDKFIGQPMKKRLMSTGDSLRLAVHSFADAYLWDGKPKNCSWWN